MKQDIYYTPSGKFPIYLPPLSFAFGIVISAIGGFIYSYAMYYIPFLYINFIFTIALGILLGMGTGFINTLLKNRNIKFSFLSGFITGIFGIYFSWVFYVKAFTKGTVYTFQPEELLEIIHEFSKTGTFEIKGLRPTGIFLYTFWIIESFLILVSSLFIPYFTTISAPFCEHCNIWLEGEDYVGPLEHIKNSNLLKEEIETRNYNILKELKTVSSNTNHFTIIELFYCTTCDHSYFTTIKDIEYTYDSKGKESKLETSILENVIISHKVFEELKSEVRQAKEILDMEKEKLDEFDEDRW
ncbi:MAG: hypothetical protein H7A25_10845 [Leptospiraceae bacterium]|nr:hypothetical protein [Leptospiraceae bacterium]MCP5500392.1 hypothetical protein [Leptospiraceae bacterium]